MVTTKIFRGFATKSSEDIRKILMPPPLMATIIYMGAFSGCRFYANLVGRQWGRAGQGRAGQEEGRRTLPLRDNHKIIIFFATI
jgi:hypothetical protein